MSSDCFHYAEQMEILKYVFFLHCFATLVSRSTLLETELLA